MITDIDQLYNDLISTLRIAFMSSGMSYDELAEKSQLAKSTIHGAFNRTRYIRLDTLIRLARALGITSMELDFT